MPKMCECQSPAISPSNPYVCIRCGGMLHNPRPMRRQPDAPRRTPRDSFGNFDPSDELLDHLDDQR